MTIKPHPVFEILRPDEVAECFTGVVRDGDFTLYSALWNSLLGRRRIAEVIDVENSAPHDALGVNSVASLWDRFTDEQKIRLNALAGENELEGAG